MTDTDQVVSFSIDGDVAVIRLDDGKANALSHDVLDAVLEALDRAEEEAKAAVILGREGRFSAGFHLPTMMAGMDSALPLLKKGAEVAIRIYTARVPVVLGVTGHALAMGAILLMSADLRIGAQGSFKVGMPEVAIGMPVPHFAAMVAQVRLSPRHLVPALALATIYGPDEAVQVGYLDRVVPAEEIEDSAIAEAAHLAGTLNLDAFRLTRDIMHADDAERFRAAIERDMAEFDILA